MTRNTKVVLSIEYITKYARGLLRGISNYVRFNGPWTILGTPGFHLDPETVKHTIDFNDIKNFAPDGAILRIAEDYEKVKKLGIPAVLADDNDHAPDAPSVVSDYEETAKIAAAKK